VIRNSNRGIGLFLRRGETIENILFSNIVIETRLYRGKWWGKGELIHVSALAEFEGDSQTRTLRNVTFSNVIATGDHGIVIHADQHSTIENVTFNDVRVTLQPGPLQETFGGNFDFRPVWNPHLKVFSHDIPAFYAYGVKALALRNVAVEWRGPLPAFVRHAIQIERFDDVLIEGFRGRQAQSVTDTATGDASIVLRDGRAAVLRHSTLTPGAAALFAAENVTDLNAEPPRRL
jgi:hypothetical protein